MEKSTEDFIGSKSQTKKEVTIESEKGTFTGTCKKCGFGLREVSCTITKKGKIIIDICPGCEKAREAWKKTHPKKI